MPSLMHLTHRPSLHKSAEGYACDVLGVWTQTDTWDTHAYVLYHFGAGTYAVSMFNVEQPRKGTHAPLDDVMAEIENGCPDDEREFQDNLAEALLTIADGESIDFATDEQGIELASVYAVAKERS
jgi:hypothetical protein